MANVSQQKILSASQGNSASLLEVLNQLSQVTVEQQTVTGTTSTSTGTKVSSTAEVPAQASGSASLLNSAWIVQIVNPGAKSAISSIQAAAAGQSATASTNLQAVKSIYHQIRASTSPAFNVNSETQTFGGDTGNAQTYWTLTGLGSGKWYFQFRSTYDGTNFNTWKNLNNSISTSEITVEAETNCAWAVFELPGKETVGVGQGFGADGAGIGLPANKLYTSAMFALVAPNGFNTEPPQVTDIAASAIVLQKPTGTSTTGTTGILDYPALIDMKYGNRSYPQSTYSGNANVFLIAFDPSGDNTTVYDSSDGTSSWVVITLPGGSKIAFGSGTAADGADIYIPSECPWITSSNLLVTPTIQGETTYTGHGAHGVQDCSITGLTVSAKYSDYGSASNVWTGNANWIAVAWTPGREVVEVTGGKFVVIKLADGNKIAFGAGHVSSGASFGLPTGFSSSQMCAIPTPRSFSNSGDNVLHAVSQCDISGTTANLTYIDGSGNSWSGDVNWFAFCWANASTTTPSSGGIAVSVNPSQYVLSALGTVTFTATVSGTTTTTVTWSVDGVVGGNSTVGTIVDGVYTAPSDSGNHVIRAVSTADPTRVGTASVQIGTTASGVAITSGIPTVASYIGAVAFDPATLITYTYTSSGWVVSSSPTTVSNTAPTGTSYIGAQVFDSTAKVLYIYTASGWVAST